ncbi:hypothetical protein DL93DRAFT_2087058 [Clavulina sp. PMI_390]|nr:hypothetical protein DL93DRAFT_2087058 [Clavulina sp. PMI_390]
MGITWWLVPTAASAKPIEAAINEAHTRHHGPSFPAHVTLFSLPSTSKTNDALIQATKSTLATSSPGTVITLAQGQVTIGETFHQSVFLALKPTQPLTSLRTALLKATGASTKTESANFPHASLYYGDGSSEDKHHVVAHLMDAQKVDIALDGTLEVSSLPAEGVSFDAVWIMDIGGKNPSDWKVIHKEPLSGSKASDPATASTITANGGSPAHKRESSRLSYLAESGAPIPGLPVPSVAPLASTLTPATIPETKEEVITEKENGKGKEENGTPAPAAKAEATPKPKQGFGAKLKKLLCF